MGTSRRLQFVLSEFQHHEFGVRAPLRVDSGVAEEAIPSP